jgi:DNA-binding CsgD family transcriptional regulator
LTVLAGDLTHQGCGEEGIARFRDALKLAAQIGDHWGLDRVYTNLTDALTMLGRPRQAAVLGREGTEVLRRYGIHSALVVANRIEALLESGDWQEADAVSAGALRQLVASFQYVPLLLRAELELGRGHFDDASAHMQAARPLVHDRLGTITYCRCRAELALWQRRWADAQAAADDGLEQAGNPGYAELEAELCATGLRAQAELAALARARRHTDHVQSALTRAAALLDQARRAAASAASLNPNIAGWRALADAEYARTIVTAPGQPALWSAAAERWDSLQRPPRAAYCRWREAEALIAAGATHLEATAPLRAAHQVAARIGAQPLLSEIELLAQRARLDLTQPPSDLANATHPLQALGLTPREAEVLVLLARGRTNREIAAELMISVKTVGVHVSHILHKLGAPNRIEAAAIAHRFESPHVEFS